MVPQVPLEETRTSRGTPATSGNRNIFVDPGLWTSSRCQSVHPSFRGDQMLGRVRFPPIENSAKSLP